MSYTFRELADKYCIPVRAVGDIDLVQLRDCTRVVQACMAENLFILGIEGFRIDGTNIVPDTDWIADFSKIISNKGDIKFSMVADSANAFFDLAKSGEELWFEFELMTPRDASLT
jgi:hypothetical protein